MTFITNPRALCQDVSVRRSGVADRIPKPNFRSLRHSTHTHTYKKNHPLGHPSQVNTRRVYGLRTHRRWNERVHGRQCNLKVDLSCHGTIYDENGQQQCGRGRTRHRGRNPCSSHTRDFLLRGQSQPVRILPRCATKLLFWIHLRRQVGMRNETSCVTPTRASMHPTDRMLCRFKCALNPTS